MVADARRSAGPPALRVPARLSAAAGRASEALDRAALALAAGLAAVMAAAMLAQVVFRFVLEAPLSWSEELGRYCFVWVSMLGAAGGVRRGLHPALELVEPKLPAAFGPWWRAAVLLAGLAFAGLVSVYGLSLARFNMRQRSPVMGLPMELPYAAIPAGGLLIALHLLAALLGRRGAGPAADVSPAGAGPAGAAPAGAGVACGGSAESAGGRPDPRPGASGARPRGDFLDRTDTRPGRRAAGPRPGGGR